MRLLPPALLLLAAFASPPTRAPQVSTLSPSPLGLLLQDSPSQHAAYPRPDRHHFKYSRAITVPPGADPRACVTLDAATFVHAQPALADLRLFSGTTEIPYALTLSETRPTTDPATVLNRGLRAGHVVFDLKMPARPYTQVNLDLNGSDFLVNARVYGLTNEHESGTLLGTFTLFDLSRQGLARNTTLPLPESTFPYLHVDLQFLDPGHPIALLSPAIVAGASIPPSREAQTLYTTVAQTTELVQRSRETTVTFQVPAHLPVERVSFAIGGEGPFNFSRDVSVRARAQGDPNAMREEVTGQISRIKLLEQGRQINYESLSFPAIVGSNGQSDALIEVSVDNGDDPPLAIHAVRLDMRERKLCFDAPETPVDLFYGDPTLQPPVYDYSRLFSPTAAARSATLHAELPNPFYQPPPIKRPGLLERHPVLLWIALLAVASILGAIAFLSSRRV